MDSATQIDLFGIRVLCIDDDPVMRAIVREALHRRGCRAIEQAPDGVEALRLCSDRTYDLLICDFQMAPMNGLTFLGELCKAGYGANLPVIMLSAEADPAAIAAAQDMGISAWVPKPVSINRLVERIAAVMGPMVMANRGKAEMRRADCDCHHTRLMAAIASSERMIAGLSYRQVAGAGGAHPLLRALDEISNHADVLGYGLVRHLAERGVSLLRSISHPAPICQHHPEVVAALGSIVTAIKRVAWKRMSGDGGVTGLKLLSAIDDTLINVASAPRVAMTDRLGNHNRTDQEVVSAHLQVGRY